jgi:hypothetical protein
MTGQQIRERADRLRALPLESVLQVWGARRDHDDPRKWHTSQGVLSVNGAKFMNWNRASGGEQNITFAVSRADRSFRSWLERYHLMELIDPARFYPTNRHAAQAFRQSPESGTAAPDISNQ